MIRRELLLELGGFDPDFFPHEDSDLCYRLRKSGYIIVVDFYSGVAHERSKEHRNNQLALIPRARIRYQIKHSGILHTYLRRTNWVNYSWEPTPYRLLKMIKDRSFFKTGVPLLFYLLKANIWNLYHLAETPKSRNKNFLKDRKLVESIKLGDGF
jgi:GT2 family glycosyltransferase